MAIDKNTIIKDANIRFPIDQNLYRKLSIIRGKRKIGINSFVKEIIESVVDTAVFYIEGRDNNNKEYFFNKGVLTWRSIN
jgi:hypothetical protein